MELVEGVPITQYCDSNRLTTEERLALLRPDLPRRPARAPQGCHPPGHQAVERAGARCRTSGRSPRSSTSASRRRPRSRSPTGRCSPRFGSRGRHAGLHEPRAGRAAPGSMSIPAPTSTRWECCSTSCWSASCRSTRADAATATPPSCGARIREDEPTKPSTRLTIARRDLHRAGPAAARRSADARRASCAAIWIGSR